MPGFCQLYRMLIMRYQGTQLLFRYLPSRFTKYADAAIPDSVDLLGVNTEYTYPALYLKEKPEQPETNRL